jgi:hypothetical protein
VSTEHLSDGEYEVRGGGALWQLSRESEADNFRGEHVDWLAKHHSFGFDPAHAPANDAQAIDHGGVTVGAHKAVRVGHAVGRHHDSREVFKIDLMNNSRGWWNDAEVVERLLAPPQKLVTFHVAGKFDFHVALECKAAGEFIDLNTMVNDEVAGHKGVDFFGITTHADHGASESCKINHSWYAGEVLQHDATGLERHFDFRGFGRIPVCKIHDVVCGDDKVINVAEAGFKKHANRKGQRFDVADAIVSQFPQAEIANLARGCVQNGFGAEWVCCTHKKRWLWMEKD